jgi:hypothetical protein
LSADEIWRCRDQGLNRDRPPDDRGEGNCQRERGREVSRWEGCG